jgi:hypothetical protein
MHKFVQISRNFGDWIHPHNQVYDVPINSIARPRYVIGSGMVLIHNLSSAVVNMRTLIMGADLVCETSVIFNNLMCLSAPKYFIRHVQTIAKSDHLLLRVFVHLTECLSTWKNWSLTVFMKFDIRIYFKNLSRKFNFDNKNNWNLIWRPI